MKFDPKKFHSLLFVIITVGLISSPLPVHASWLSGLRNTVTSWFSSPHKDAEKKSYTLPILATALTVSAACFAGYWFWPTSNKKNTPKKPQNFSNQKKQPTEQPKTSTGFNRSSSKQHTTNQALSCAPTNGSQTSHKKSEQKNEDGSPKNQQHTSNRQNAPTYPRTKNSTQKRIEREKTDLPDIYLVMEEKGIHVSPPMEIRLIMETLKQEAKDRSSTAPNNAGLASEKPQSKKAKRDNNNNSFATSLISSLAFELPGPALDVLEKNHARKISFYAKPTKQKRKEIRQHKQEELFTYQSQQAQKEFSLRKEEEQTRLTYVAQTAGCILHACKPQNNKK